MSIERLTAPGAFDRKRVEMAVRRRKRYRYVKPEVRTIEGGFLIESPCCSRRVDASGGVIPIALLQQEPEVGWMLYRMDHAVGEWKLYGVYPHLADLLEPLQLDPERIFWQ